MHSKGAETITDNQQNLQTTQPGTTGQAEAEQIASKKIPLGKSIF
jgi:hypothetical protein